MPSESTITRNILKWLNAQEGCFAMKFHGGRYSTAGIPDVLFRRRDPPLTLWFEVKRPGGLPTKLQRVMIERLDFFFDGAHVVYSLDDVKEIIDAKT